MWVRQLIAGLGVIVALVSPSWSTDVSPLSPETPLATVQEQADYLAAFVKDQVEAHWTKWRKDEIEQYANAVKAILLDNLKQPLQTQQLEAFQRDFQKNLAAGEHNPEDDSFVTRATSVAIMIELIKWETQEFVRRKEISPQEQATLDQQIRDIVAWSKGVTREAFPTISGEIIEVKMKDIEQRLLDESRNVLRLSLKRPLSPEEIASVKQGIQEGLVSAQQWAKQKEQFYRNWPDRKDKAAEYGQMDGFMQGIAQVASLLRRPGYPDQPQSYREVMARLGEEHDRLSKEWMERQDRQAKERFVKDLLGPTPDQIEQTLFLFELMFLLQSSIDRDSGVLLY